MNLRAVIFDLDGVLCSTDEYHYQSWKRMAEAYGIPFTRQDNEKLRGLTRRRSLETILKGNLLPEEQMQAMMDQKDQYFQILVRQMSPAELPDGVGRLLRELRRAGLKVGVASASRNVKVVLHKLGIAGYIEAFCDGNSRLPSKPAPDIYLQTAAALRVNPSACLAVEDSPAGIQAAQEAGMCVIGLGPGWRVAEAHAAFKDLAGVRLNDLLEVYASWRAETRPPQASGYRSFL